MTKPDVLQGILASILERGTLAVAFSGGLDSRFLAHMALKTAPERVRLLHATGLHTTLAETVNAEQWATSRGATFYCVTVNPLEIPEVRANTRERCYHCKRGLFRALLEQAGDAVLVDGSNASDKQGYRPGLRALAELGIRSPLMEANLDKPQIHELAAATGLSQPWQRARPCLLTRFPYDTPITEPLLRELEALEARIQSFLGDGPDSPDFRLRVESGAPFLLQLQSDDQALADELLQSFAGMIPFPPFRIALTTQVSGLFDQGSAGR